MKENILQPIERAHLFALAIDAPFFDPDEVLDLHDKVGPTEFFRATLDVSDDYFEKWHSVLNIKKNRRAEVALYVERSDKKLLLHTKPFYPPGIYRIPTGGINPGEKVIDAVHRELYEETGFTANAVVQPAVLAYAFQNDGRVIHFVSHLFKVMVDGGEPHPKDDDENITGYQWIEPTQIVGVIHQLKSLKEQWHDWGVMRALPHEIVAALWSKKK